MKRSEINAIMRRADDFLRRQNFYLPPFAAWTPEEWAQKDASVHQIVDTHLGWDITDFGGGDFAHRGLLLFTLRNGLPAAINGKTYAEKVLIIEAGQETPLHFHWSKMEDIINRGGEAELCLQLYCATDNEQLDEHTSVDVIIDGVSYRKGAGEVIRLGPGESITLPPYCYHRFWAEGGTALVGEVSQVNDDNADNRFLNGAPRFPTVEEDEAPLYLLCTDYPRYWRGEA